MAGAPSAKLANPAQSSREIAVADRADAPYNAVNYAESDQSSFEEAKMTSSRKILGLPVVPLALSVLWLLNGCADSPRAGVEQSGGGNQVQAHLEQAAAAIIAAAKESVHTATSDEEAINKTQLSGEALPLSGMLGDFDSEAQTEKLLDELQ